MRHWIRDLHDVIAGDKNHAGDLHRLVESHLGPFLKGIPVPNQRHREKPENK